MVEQKAAASAVSAGGAVALAKVINKTFVTFMRHDVSVRLKCVIDVTTK